MLVSPPPLPHNAPQGGATAASARGGAMRQRAGNCFLCIGLTAFMLSALGCMGGRGNGGGGGRGRRRWARYSRGDANRAFPFQCARRQSSLHADRKRIGLRDGGIPELEWHGPRAVHNRL